MSGEWRLRAACRGEDPEMFFESVYELFAMRLCARCPVRRNCLASALEAEGESKASHRSGIWGGLTPDERTALVGGARAAA